MIVWIKKRDYEKRQKKKKKKCHLKNDKVEHVLLYYFLNNGSHTQIMPSGKKNLFDHMC